MKDRDSGGTVVRSNFNVKQEKGEKTDSELNDSKNCRNRISA